MGDFPMKNGGGISGDSLSLKEWIHSQHTPRDTHETTNGEGPKIFVLRPAAGPVFVANFSSLIYFSRFFATGEGEGGKVVLLFEEGFRFLGRIISDFRREGVLAPQMNF